MESEEASDEVNNCVGVCYSKEVFIIGHLIGNTDYNFRETAGGFFNNLILWIKNR